MKPEEKDNSTTKTLVKIISKWKRKKAPLTRDSRSKRIENIPDNRTPKR